MNFNYEIRSFWTHALRQRVGFNINLTKFGQQDVKGGKKFFPSSLRWGVISLNLKGEKCNYPLYLLKKKKL